VDVVKILELFGGVGAPRRALLNLGIPVKAIDYVEIDEKAVKSYNAMFANELQHKPQSVVGWNLKPDILIHGSPCQDFSIAGKQKGADINSETRSSLMWETLTIIKQMGIWKPKIVIWENVKNVLSKHMIHNFNGYLAQMEQLGYTNSFDVLNAYDFGLPQKRERIFTISMLGGNRFNFDLLERKQVEHIDKYLQSIDEVHEKYIVTQPSMLKRIGVKGTAFSRNGDIITDCAMSITTKQLRYPNSGVIDIGNGKYRLLTERECWRLQGFNDEDYESALSANPSRDGKMNGALYKQAGNSIPVMVLEAIFKQLLFGVNTSNQISINEVIMAKEVT
jgi:DNA (cytosine-5)-methyltransferase 1